MRAQAKPFVGEGSAGTADACRGALTATAGVFDAHPVRARISTAAPAKRPQSSSRRRVDGELTRSVAFSASSSFGVLDLLGAWVMGWLWRLAKRCRRATP